MTFKFFYGQKCSKCPPFKDLVKDIKIDGEWIDTATVEGFELAKKFNVSSVPTIIFFEDDKEKFRFTEKEPLIKYLEAQDAVTS